MRHIRNAAIVVGLALIVAFAPGGGNGADTVLTALTMAFLVAIGFAAYRFSRENELTLAALGDGSRALLFGALGMIVLLIAGTDEFFDSGGGTLAWILLLGASVAAIWRVWAQASTY